MKCGARRSGHFVATLNRYPSSDTLNRPASTKRRRNRRRLTGRHECANQWLKVAEKQHPHLGHSFGATIRRQTRRLKACPIIAQGKRSAALGLKKENNDERGSSDTGWSNTLRSHRARVFLFPSTQGGATLALGCDIVALQATLRRLDLNG